MPDTPTYSNLARHAWKLIQQINSHHSPMNLTAFLGPTGTAIIARHFPANWLSGIKVHIAAQVPTPDLNRLWQAMGYAKLDDFMKACRRINLKLFGVLWAFSQGAGFNGITYDSTIYLAAAKSDELALTLHELVHTLQWACFKAEPFLERYIRGFTTNYPKYQNNPAERPAYYFEDQFQAKVKGLGPIAKGAAVVSIWKKGMANTPGMQTVRAQLTSMPSLNITGAAAIQGM